MVYLYSVKIVESSACFCGFVNERAFHFFLVCPLYNGPRVTLQNTLVHMAPFTIRTLSYGVDNLELSENKRIISAMLEFINDLKRFD